jgi:hypothetical protein
MRQQRDTIDKLSSAVRSERADWAGVAFKRVVVDLASRGPGPCSAI